MDNVPVYKVAGGGSEPSMYQLSSPLYPRKRMAARIAEWLIAGMLSLTEAIQCVENGKFETQCIDVGHVQKEESMQDRSKSRRLRTYRCVAADIGLANYERQF